MTPKVHLIRHAQGYHNLGPEYWNLEDPLLTEEGKKQCLELSHKFSQATIDLVVTSPMRRAIYTAIEAFGSILGQEREIITLASLQEVSDCPCDKGSEFKALQNEVEQNKLPVDLSFVEETWPDKSGKYESTVDKIQSRAQEARRWLKARPEEEIAVVTHGGFLHFLTEDWEDGSKLEGTGWTNTECRTYEFISLQEDPENDNTSMQETTESRQRRGKLDSPLTLDCQKDLCNKMLQNWANQGCPIRSA